VVDVSQADKEALFELAQVGETFGPVELVVDDHKIKTFAFMQDDYRPWHFGPSPFGPRIGHAAILANDLLQLYHLRYAEYGVSKAVGIHSAEEFWLESPVHAGERVVMEARYVDKYERRGKGYVVMEGEARGEDGRVLVRHRGTEIMRHEAGGIVGARSQTQIEDRVSCEVLAGAEPLTHAVTGAAAGTPVVALEKVARPVQMGLYYLVISPFARTIHNDLEAANAAGLRLPIMQGQQQASYVSELMTGYFGPSWFTSGWFKVKFVSPLYAFETVSVEAAVVGDEEEAGGVRQKLEVWVMDGSGTTTLVGWASALVDEGAR
jgi:acyl dehydratase